MRSATSAWKRGWRLCAPRLELGITHFDTSPFYGRGISEAILGIALQRSAAREYTISTKLGDMTKINSTFVQAECMKASIQACFGWVSTTWISSFCMTWNSPISSVRSTMRCPRYCGRRKRAKCDTSASPGIRSSRCCTPSPTTKSTSRSITTTTRCKTAGWSMKCCRCTNERGVGVLNAAPFAQRLLTHFELPAWHPADRRSAGVCRQAIVSLPLRRILNPRSCVCSFRHIIRAYLLV